MGSSLIETHWTPPVTPPDFVSALVMLKYGDTAGSFARRICWPSPLSLTAARGAADLRGTERPLADTPPAVPQRQPEAKQAEHDRSGEHGPRRASAVGQLQVASRIHEIG